MMSSLVILLVFSSMDLIIVHHGVRFPCRHDFSWMVSTPALRCVAVVVHIFPIVELV
jgi:hypothetical protein